MSPFLGGSAVAMAAQIAEGYTLVTTVQLKRLSEAELGQLQFELERTLRDLRGTAVAQDDVAAVQARNRKVGRLTGSLRQVQASLSQRKRTG